MVKINKILKLFLNLAKIQAIMTRRFDSCLGGLGFSEFVILYHLSTAEGGKMRRVDLAEKVGLTASGVTRLLLPMEKVRLVKREANKDDARVSSVVLTSAGKQKMTEAIERAELFVAEIVSSAKVENFSELDRGVLELGRFLSGRGV